ncbi:MAG TPA: hypothetical protein DEP53_08755 [Bacteroidetes bacterium]|nr:hypothetical protein [Bacteroidota bacterium]
MLAPFTPIAVIGEVSGMPPMIIDNEHRCPVMEQRIRLYHIPDQTDEKISPLGRINVLLPLVLVGKRVRRCKAYNGDRRMMLGKNISFGRA